MAQVREKRIARGTKYSDFGIKLKDIITHQTFYKVFYIMLYHDLYKYTDGVNKKSLWTFYVTGSNKDGVNLMQDQETFLRYTSDEYIRASLIRTIAILDVFLRKNRDDSLKQLLSVIVKERIMRERGFSDISDAEFVYKGLEENGDIDAILGYLKLSHKSTDIEKMFKPYEIASELLENNSYSVMDAATFGKIVQMYNEYRKSIELNTTPDNPAVKNALSGVSRSQKTAQTIEAWNRKDPQLVQFIVRALDYKFNSGKGFSQARNINRINDIANVYDTFNGIVKGYVTISAIGLAIAIYILFHGLYSNGYGMWMCATIIVVFLITKFIRMMLSSIRENDAVHNM